MQIGIGLLIFGAICAYIHGKKGYSLVAGFCWGFFFDLIGLAVVLLEKTKEENEQSGKKGLSVLQWLLIFVGIGTLVIMALVFVVMPLLG